MSENKSFSIGDLVRVECEEKDAVDFGFERSLIGHTGEIIGWFRDEVGDDAAVDFSGDELNLDGVNRVALHTCSDRIDGDFGQYILTRFLVRAEPLDPVDFASGEVSNLL